MKYVSFKSSDWYKGTTVRNEKSINVSPSESSENDIEPSEFVKKWYFEFDLKLEYSSFAACVTFEYSQVFLLLLNESNFDLALL